LLIQIIILKKLKQISENLPFINTAFSVFLILNIYSTHLGMSSEFIHSSSNFKIIASLIGLFVCYSIFSMMDEIKKARLWIPAFVFMILAGNIIYHVVKTEEPNYQVSSQNNIKLVDFKEKPNVYILLFDSLIPKALLKKYMGLEKVKYHDVLGKNFYRFKNFFTDGVSSKIMINMFLAFNKNYYFSLGSERYHFFQGKSQSLLFNIFRHNGYEINTAHDTRYFGDEGGPHVDNYYMRQRLAVCSYLPENTKLTAFFGYCELMEIPFIKSFVGGLVSSTNQEPFEFIMNIFKKGLSRPKPKIFVTYIWSPGHTQKSYDHENKKKREVYAARFQKNSEKTAEYLEEMITFVKGKDPSAFIYVLGDHGPILSRRVEYKNDKEFFVQDHYGVYGGFYPADKCKASFAKPYSQKYVTAIQGMHMIIRCLSGGENAFIKLDDYRLQEKRIEGTDNYENYLYE
jgi:hypothetical protein